MKKMRWCLAALCVMLLTLSARNRATAPGTTPVPEPNTTQGTGIGGEQASQPTIPERLTRKDGVPQLKVYNVSDKKLKTMDIETYVEGVLAGEMPGDWPLEALKAQAILARTFVLKFVEEKKSRYEGADISTDIAEAQAYDASKITARTRQAVKDTRGMVLSYQGKLPYAWFHAHAGGITARAKEGLEYKQAEPGYTQVVKSPDSANAPMDVKSWTATFSKAQVIKAAKEAGAKVNTANKVSVGAKGESGRAVTLTIDGKEVSAPGLRIHLDSAKLKSTLISAIEVSGDKVTFSGSGYGHGVGMSQWGAYGMAQNGQKTEQILKHYFRDVTVTNLWK